MSKIFQWLENIWNLRLIFDKYLPKIKELVETIKTLQKQVEELKQFKNELEGNESVEEQTETEDNEEQD